MTEHAHASDEELLRWSAAGNEEAFATLYRRRQSSVYRFALHMSGREDVADEVTQEVFVALIREPGRYDSARGPLAGYLLGVARNHVLKLLHRDRANVVMEDDEAAGLAAGDGDILLHLTREEAIDAVRQAVLSLPPSYREVVVLCDLEEMSYADAAGLIGVPVGTVRSRLNRGRGLLLEKLRAGGLGKSAVGCSA